MIKLLTMQHGLVDRQGNLTPKQELFLELVHDELSSSVAQESDAGNEQADDSISELKSEYKRRLK